MIAITRLAASALALSVLASPVLAHHSGAMFDQTKLVEVKGRLVEYKFQQPHSWLSVMAPDGTGKEVRWDVEAASTSTMRRMGLTPDAIKPGMEMVVSIHPLRDGRRGGSLAGLTVGGKVYSNGYTQNPYGTGRDDDGGVKVKSR
jgi:hypothetical protein